MSTHGALTESSRSYHPVTPDRKGREGKGREVGHACIVSTGSERSHFDGSRAARSRRCMRRYAAGIES